MLINQTGRCREVLIGFTERSQEPVVFSDPATLCRENQYITPVNDPVYQPETFYYTDAISDNAATFVSDHLSSTPDAPFFLYVAYTAAIGPCICRRKRLKSTKGFTTRDTR